VVDLVLLANGLRQGLVIGLATRAETVAPNRIVSSSNVVSVSSTVSCSTAATSADSSSTPPSAARMRATAIR
jgi:hypothetical protein